MICSRLSTEHGPAITTTRLPPIATFPTHTTESRPPWNSRLTSLYGCRMRTTLSTPAMASRLSRRSSFVWLSPTTPITMRSTPSETCARSPASSIFRTTASRSSRVCSGLITTIMLLPPCKTLNLPPYRDGRFAMLPRCHPTSLASSQDTRRGEVRRPAANLNPSLRPRRRNPAATTQPTLLFVSAPHGPIPPGVSPALPPRPRVSDKRHPRGTCPDHRVCGNYYITEVKREPPTTARANRFGIGAPRGPTDRALRTADPPVESILLAAMGPWRDAHPIMNGHQGRNNEGRT